MKEKKADLTHSASCETNKAHRSAGRMGREPHEPKEALLLHWTHTPHSARKVAQTVTATARACHRDRQMSRRECCCPTCWMSPLTPCTVSAQCPWQASTASRTDVILPSLATGFSPLRALRLSHSDCSLYFYPPGSQASFSKAGTGRRESRSAAPLRDVLKYSLATALLHAPVTHCPFALASALVARLFSLLTAPFQRAKELFLLVTGYAHVLKPRAFDGGISAFIRGDARQPISTALYLQYRGLLGQTTARQAKLHVCYRQRGGRLMG